MKKLWLIIKREYLTRVRKRSFILGTLLTPLAFGLFFIVVGFIFSYESDEDKTIAVVDKGNILENKIKDTKHLYFLFPNKNLDELKTYVHQETKIDKKKLVVLLRYAFTGEVNGPKLGEVYPLIKNYLGELVK